MYLAIVLNSDDRSMLIDKFFPGLDLALQPNAEIILHHCTICMGNNSKGKYPFTEGEEVPMVIDAIGHLHGYEVQNDPRFAAFNLPGDDLFGARYMVTALRVRLPEGKVIKNAVPHITGAVLRQYGARPFHSNKIKHWMPLKNEIVVRGTVTLCGTLGTVKQPFKKYDKLAELAGGPSSSVKKFIEDINILLSMGMWWSDCVEICLALNNYGFDKTTENWGKFLDILVGEHTVATRKPISLGPLFLNDCKGDKDGNK